MHLNVVKVPDGNIGDFLFSNFLFVYLQKKAAYDFKLQKTDTEICERL